jgi:hypothetical protein
MMGLDGAEALVGGGGGGTAALGLPSLIGGAINGTRGAWIAVTGFAVAFFSHRCRHTVHREDGLGAGIVYKTEDDAEKTCRLGWALVRMISVR